ncbi:MAG: hypothetical protein H0T20_09660 [Actinobacteria bacterium]|nr:hypothetical protein [Actinomycetota bacterium]
MPTHRRRGIGTTLLERALAHLENRNGNGPNVVLDSEHDGLLHLRPGEPADRQVLPGVRLRARRRTAAERGAAADDGALHGHRRLDRERGGDGSGGRPSAAAAVLRAHTPGA